MAEGGQVLWKRHELAFIGGLCVNLLRRYCSPIFALTAEDRPQGEG